jgi:hypothetical protein
MKKQVLAIAAAAAILCGAGTASATGGHWGTYNDNYNNNKNYNDNYNNNSNVNNNNINNSNKNKNINDNSSKNKNINNNNSTAKAKSNANATSNSNATSSSTATGGDATATATGGSATSSAAGGEGGNGGGGGNSNVNVEGDDVAASSAAPIALTTSNDTCMGSTGLGVQGMQFGFSIGSTWTDSNCIMLKNSRELKMQGHNKAAKARLCMDSDNAMAFELAGEPCPRALKSTQAAIATLGEWKADYAATTAPQTAALPNAAKAKAATVIVEVEGEDDLSHDE